MFQMFTENRWIICQSLFAGYLVILSVMDIRRRSLPLMLLMSGGIFIAAGAFCGRQMPIALMAAGAATGLVFLVISKVTQESFGYGDSILILIMGGFLGIWNTLYVLMGAFTMAAVYSAVMLIRTRFGRKSAFPFVPFLTAAYIGGMLLGGY